MSNFLESSDGFALDSKESFDEGFRSIKSEQLGSEDVI
jgi:hypothetical protein